MQQLYCLHRLLPVLFLLLLGGRSPAAAQFLWQHTVGTAAYDETGEYMSAVRGGFVTIGQSTNSGPPQGLYLSKLNYAGDTLWTRRWPFRGLNVVYPRGLIEDGAGNLVVSAIVSPPPVTPTAPPSPTQGMLVKLTATGDTLWTRRVASSGTLESVLTTLVLGNDGSYMAVGELTGLPALFKFSPAGVLLWTQVITYSGTIPGALKGLVAVPNGYVVVSVPGRLRSRYITVDETGAYQFDRLGAVAPPAQLLRDGQGNLMAVGDGITKLSPQGDSIWSHSYRQYNAAVGINRLVALPNGRYLAAGTRYNGNDRDLALVLVDHNGTLLRDTLLVRFLSNETVGGMALTPTGDYVVAGGTDVGPNGGADQLIFAYRNWDRLLPAGARVTQPQSTLTASPNPTTDEVTLVAADAHVLAGSWVLYDALGRSVQAGTLPGLARARLPLAGQPAGLYLLRVAEAAHATPHTLRIEKQ